MAHEFTPLQRAWVDRLRSGKDPQTQGILAEVTVDGDVIGYCCLGLGCEVAAESGAAISRSEIEHHFDNGYKRAYVAADSRRSGTSLRGLLKLPLGMRHPEGYIPSLRDRDDIACGLSGLNDSGFTFAQIADVIEYFAEDLFVPTPVAA